MKTNPLWKPILTLTLASFPVLASASPGNPSGDVFHCAHGEDLKLKIWAPTFNRILDGYLMDVYFPKFQGQPLGTSVLAQGVILEDSFDVRLTSNSSSSLGPADGKLGILRGRRVNGQWTVTYKSSDRAAEVALNCK